MQAAAGGRGCSFERCQRARAWVYRLRVFGPLGSLGQGLGGSTPCWMPPKHVQRDVKGLCVARGIGVQRGFRRLFRTQQGPSPTCSYPKEAAPSHGFSSASALLLTGISSLRRVSSLQCIQFGHCPSAREGLHDGMRAALAAGARPGGLATPEAIAQHEAQAPKASGHVWVHFCKSCPSEASPCELSAPSPLQA